MKNLEGELRDLLSKECAENESDTPDFILARYLLDCLEAWNRAAKRSDEKKIAELERALAFAQSAIRSGEPWSDSCEEIIGGALGRGNKDTPDEDVCAACGGTRFITYHLPPDGEHPCQACSSTAGCEDGESTNLTACMWCDQDFPRSVDEHGTWHLLQGLGLVPCQTPNGREEV